MKLSNTVIRKQIFNVIATVVYDYDCPLIRRKPKLFWLRKMMQMHADDKMMIFSRVSVYAIEINGYSHWGVTTLWLNIYWNACLHRIKITTCSCVLLVTLQCLGLVAMDLGLRTCQIRFKMVQPCFCYSTNMSTMTLSYKYIKLTKWK